VLQEIKVTQSIHGNMLNSLMQQRNLSGQATRLSRAIIPLKKADDVDQLNNQLKADENLFKSMVRKMI
jgi:hypothetical protein